MTDHPKEYYYKVSSSGAKNYYHRTPIGNKRIAKAKIPRHFHDKIKPYDEENDTDWMRNKQQSLKALDGVKRAKDKALQSQLDGRISEQEYLLYLLSLNHREKSCKRNISNAEDMDRYWSEQRYKEETGTYGGFKNYFKEKYQSFHDREESSPPPPPSASQSRTPYKTLEEQGILTGQDDSFKSVRHRYRRWLVKNHPDRGGSNETCAAVIREYKMYNPHS